MTDISYLKATVRGSIISDVVEIAKYHSCVRGDINAGFFSIPRLVFCYADYLGSIAYDEPSSTDRTVEFLKDFFPGDYGQYADLLVAMWRHGTVHQFVPYGYYAMRGSSEVKLLWTCSREDTPDSRRVHLKTGITKDAPPNEFRLVVNICQLADDLVSAFDKLVAKMEGDVKFMADCLRRLDCALKIKKVKGKKATQILLATDSPKPDVELDSRGRVLRRFH